MPPAARLAHQGADQRLHQDKPKRAADTGHRRAPDRRQGERQRHIRQDHEQRPEVSLYLVLQEAPGDEVKVGPAVQIGDDAAVGAANHDSRQRSQRHQAKHDQKLGRYHLDPPAGAGGDQADSAPAVLAAHRAGGENHGQYDPEAADDRKRERHGRLQEERPSQVLRGELVLLAERTVLAADAPKDRVEEDDEPHQDQRQYPGGHPLPQLEELEGEKASLFGQRRPARLRMDRHYSLLPCVSPRKTLSRSVSQGPSSER